MSQLDPLTCIHTFVAVVRAGSFTQAAERLGLTTSAVGKRMARLEQHLGLPLFHRGGRQMRLTLDGQAYFDSCASALDQIAATEAALTPQTRLLQGRVRLDMPVAFGKRIVLPLLLDIARQHPGLLLTMNFNEATVDLVRQEVDVAIRFGTLDDSSHLVARRISRQTRLICAAPSYLAAHGTPQVPEDLNGHRCIVGTLQGPPTAWMLREVPGQDDNAALRQFTPPASHQFNDGEAIIDAAVAGYGLCQMPSSLLRQPIARGALVPVLAAWTGTPVDVHVMWSRHATLSPRIRFVVDQLVAAGERGALD
ncbi:LysR family transcriptional regulator [Aquabacterium sp. OR-4]|uniref:LysR family transcriptional regulator n=1 Tax=Aquabacterium sp. OR-4 TaxID=2978127 RepID=UPI0028CA48E1|nr:LysR family transcriptional regulator [Aquabacterium sp. OR-4]MDT7839075.1 LysR family transcriptional regulator [Aquabacterium sp. OR-4]